MERDARQSGGPERAGGNREPQRASRPAPGKVTRTSRLSSSRGPAVQRKAAAPGPGSGGPQVRSAWDHTMDPWMDAAHRGVTALAERGHQDSGAIQAKGLEGTPDVPAHLPGNGGGAAMPEDVRGKMEASLGADFSPVRIHEGPQAEAIGALAYTQGTDIHFAPGQYQPSSQRGQELLGHELTHVVQQSQGRVGATTQAKAVNINNDASLEREADEMGARAARGERSRGQSSELAIGPQPMGARARGGDGSALQLQPAPAPAPGVSPPPGPAPATPLSPHERALDGQDPWTQALAEQAMNAYGALSATERAAWIRRWSPRGQIGPMLRALDRADIAYGGRFENTLRDIQQRFQRSQGIAEAAAQGIPSEAEMAQEQANFMHAANVAAATAAQPQGSAPPTAADVAAQQQTQVAATSIAPQAQTLSRPREARLTTQANAAVARFVRWVNTTRRELPITAANFRVAVREVFDRGDGIIAFADGGTPPVCVVGESFASAVTRNPAYALPTVVHELWGHNEYGEYAEPGTEYGLELYDRAAARMPGYTQPTGDARTSEIDAYGYQETEIYSLMREVEYYTPNAPRDRRALDAINYDPKPAIGQRIGSMVQQWEPRVARSVVRGLLQRFRIDPRLVPAAIRAFEDGVRAHFPPADAAQILR